MGPVISDYNKRLILLSVIHLSNGHCICKISYKIGHTLPYPLEKNIANSTEEIKMKIVFSSVENIEDRWNNMDKGERFKLLSKAA